MSEIELAARGRGRASEGKTLTRAFRGHIEPFLESGLLKRTLPEKPTSRDQRYRITELGLVALAGQEDAE